MTAVIIIITGIISLILLIIAIFLLVNGNEKKSGIFNLFASLFLACITVIQSFNVHIPPPNIFPLNAETKNCYNKEKITITADEGYKIYYTLDGSDPKYGNKYEEAIIITETKTVCARAKFLFWWSDIQKSAYHFTDSLQKKDMSSLKWKNILSRKNNKNQFLMGTFPIVDRPIPKRTVTSTSTAEPIVTPIKKLKIFSPDLLGMDEATAINTCIQNGYKYDVEYYLGGNGTVISQSPSNDEIIEPGDSISINIGIPQDDFTNKLLALINNRRDSLGLNQLMLNGIYTQGTQILARENVTSDYDDCTRPDGTLWSSVYPDNLNVAITGYFTTRNNISSLSNANNRIPYTDDCLLNPEFCYIGIAYSDSNMLVIVVGSSLIGY